MACPITQLTLTWGESLEITATAQDVHGDDIIMDNTWLAALRITHQSLGNKPFMDSLLTITDGKASASFDTGDRIWSPGIYVYDIRLTNPEGDDFWSEPVELKLLQRNTPISTP